MRDIARRRARRSRSAYFGRHPRVRRVRDAEHIADQIVNLNTARDAGELEAALARRVPERGRPRVRRSRVVPLHGRRSGEPGDALPNVGAIARATVGTESIARAKSLHVFADRLKDRTAERRNSRPAGHDAALHGGRDRDAQAVPRRADARRVPEATCCSFGVLYLLAFHVVALVWRWRRAPRRHSAAGGRAPAHRRSASPCC